MIPLLLAWALVLAVGLYRIAFDRARQEARND